MKAKRERGMEWDRGAAIVPIQSQPAQSQPIQSQPQGSQPKWSQPRWSALPGVDERPDQSQVQHPGQRPDQSPVQHPEEHPGRHRAWLVPGAGTSVHPESRPAPVPALAPALAFLAAAAARCCGFLRALSGLFRRFAARRSLRPADRPLKLAVVGRVALGPRQSLLLVEAAGTRLLVATAADGASSFFALSAARPAPARRRASW